MRLQDCLQPDLVFSNITAQSKKKALELISEQIDKKIPQLTKKEIFEALINRERLGSTGLGHGIAIPHCRIPGLQAPIALFAKLTKPIDYDAADGQSVDLIVALFVPEESTEEHLQLLAEVANIFSQRNNVDTIRKTHDGNILYNLLVSAHA